MRTATPNTKGRVIIPDKIRKVLRNRGLVKLLLSCPVNGFEIPKIQGDLRIRSNFGIAKASGKHGVCALVRITLRFALPL